MIIGSLELDLRLEGCFSLKDKRQILRAILDRLHRDFHLSASEVGDQNLWNSAVLGVACVSGDASLVESILDKVLAFLDTNPAVEIVNVDRRLIRPALD